MPIYEYQCLACGESFDKLFLSLSRVPAEITCPKCQSSDTRRLISAPAVHTGEAGGSQAEVVEPTPAKPPVFGRKELNQALEKKKQLRESATSK
jgi:putative FmdB family regulatory protein